jgi:hypothetical protein
MNMQNKEMIQRAYKLKPESVVSAQVCPDALVGKRGPFYVDNAEQILATKLGAYPDVITITVDEKEG